MIADEDEEAAAGEIMQDRFVYAGKVWCWVSPAVLEEDICGEYRRAAVKQEPT